MVNAATLINFPDTNAKTHFLGNKSKPFRFFRSAEKQFNVCYIYSPQQQKQTAINQDLYSMRTQKSYYHL